MHDLCQTLPDTFHLVALQLASAPEAADVVHVFGTTALHLLHLCTHDVDLVVLKHGREAIQGRRHVLGQRDENHRPHGVHLVAEADLVARPDLGIVDVRLLCSGQC